MTNPLDILPSLDLNLNFEEAKISNQSLAEENPESTVIKLKPVYEVAGRGCQCLGFMQFKLDGFDTKTYMQMLSNPETMQAIKEIYYSPKESVEDIQIPDRPELQLEY